MSSQISEEQKTQITFTILMITQIFYLIFFIEFCAIKLAVHKNYVLGKKERRRRRRNEQQKKRT